MLPVPPLPVPRPNRRERDRRGKLGRDDERYAHARGAYHQPLDPPRGPRARVGFGAVIGEAFDGSTRAREGGGCGHEDLRLRGETAAPRAGEYLGDRAPRDRRGRRELFTADRVRRRE